jgi:hypothetical protein
MMKMSACALTAAAAVAAHAVVHAVDTAAAPLFAVVAVRRLGANCSKNCPFCRRGVRMLARMAVNLM